MVGTRSQGKASLMSLTPRPLTLVEQLLITGKYEGLDRTPSRTPMRIDQHDNHNDQDRYCGLSRVTHVRRKITKTKMMITRTPMTVPITALPFMLSP